VKGLINPAQHVTDPDNSGQTDLLLFFCFTDEFKSTSATEALKVTFEPSLASPPIPSDLLKELANPYRRF